MSIAALSVRWDSLRLALHLLIVLLVLPLTFGSTYPTGKKNTYGVVIKDVNGDGKPDLIIANGCTGMVFYNNCSASNAGNIEVFLGNGDGTFTKSRSFSSAGNTFSLAIADFNGDGKPDVAAMNICTNSDCSDGNVAVLLGNGDGTFQAPRTYGVGGRGIRSLKVGDFNNDGKTDIVVANECAASGACFGTGGTATISILLGNGDGTFQSANSYDAGGGSAFWVVRGDFNSDGNLDIIVSVDYAGILNILSGLGDGSFMPPISYADVGAFTGTSGRFADVNNDGKLDVVFSEVANVGVLLGNGNGTSQPANVFASGGYSAVGGFDTHMVEIGDFNADGKQDLAVINECATASNCNSGTVSILLGNGDGTFQSAVSYPSGGYYPFSVAVADLNHDGKQDLVVTNECLAPKNCQTGTVTILLGDGTGAFSGGPVFPTMSTLTSRPNPSILGNTVTFTATITPAVTPNASATGTVTFMDGTTPLGSVPLANGQAVYKTTSLPVGNAIILAVYSGDTVFNPSTSQPLTEVVKKIPTKTVLTSSPNPSAFSQMVTLSASVSSKIGPPSDGENVSFYDGTTLLGTSPIASGLAIMNTSTLSIGTHSIKCRYVGNATFAASTSLIIKQIVN